MNSFTCCCLFVNLLVYLIAPINGKSFKCPSFEGIFPHPDDCSKFIKCSNGEPSTFQCGNGTVYNPNREYCDWKRNVNCESAQNLIDGDNRPSTIRTSSSTTFVTQSTSSYSSTFSPQPDQSLSTTLTTQSLSSSTTEFPDALQTLNPDELPEANTSITESDLTRQYKSNYYIVCYFESWSNYRPGFSKYYPEDINAKLCTHINYGIAILNPDTLQIQIEDPQLDITEKFYKRIISLKILNPKLKVFLTLGGFTDPGEKYSLMVSNPASRAAFISSAIEFLESFKFDGLDLAWNYPGCVTPTCEVRRPDDRINFALLIKEIKEAFKPRKLQITIAISAARRIIDAGLDIPELAKYVDWVNVMSFDYNTIHTGLAFNHAPLYRRKASQLIDPNDVIYNCNFTINYLIQLGMPSKKLVLGIPSFGLVFRLAEDPSVAPDHGYGSPIVALGNPGPYTRTAGFFSYLEICLMIRRNGWKAALDKETRYAFAYTDRDNQWVSYDNPENVAKKAFFLMSKNLRGAMVWAIDEDDFTGCCCKTQYPLLKTLYGYLRNKHEYQSIVCV